LTKQKKEKRKRVNKAIHNAGFKVESEVKQSIAGQKAEHRSVDTGRFINSVNTKLGDMVSYVVSNLPYSKYLEYGTSKITARKHFRNSLARKKPEIRRDIQTALD